MTITTLRSAFGWISGSTPETTQVINYMTWKRTPKQIVGEFFGLRQEAIYDDTWVNIVDFINDFNDLEILEQKWVHYSPRFQDFGITEQDFKNLFKKGLPILKTNEVKDGQWKSKTNWKSTSSKNK